MQILAPSVSACLPSEFQYGRSAPVMLSLKLLTNNYKLDVFGRFFLVHLDLKDLRVCSLLVSF